MVITQEEIFEYFKTTSGANRIEIMCGLMAYCIPFEIRFFTAVIQDMDKSNCNMLNEPQLRANSVSELELISKCDLLMEKVNTDEDDNAGDGSTTSSSTTSAESSSMNTYKHFPARSRLLISLCLLHPVNTTCSQIAYDIISRQLMLPEIIQALPKLVAMYHHNTTKIILKIPEIESLFTEILLLLTIAIHHPAFTYEQKDMMMKQKQEIEQFVIVCSQVVAVPQNVAVNLVEHSQQPSQTGQPSAYSNSHPSHSHSPAPPPQVAAVHQNQQFNNQPNLVAGSPHPQFSPSIHQLPGVKFSIPFHVPLVFDNVASSPGVVPVAQDPLTIPTNSLHTNMSSLRLTSSNPSPSSSSPSPKSPPNFSNQFDPPGQFVERSTSNTAKSVEPTRSGGSQSNNYNSNYYEHRHHNHHHRPHHKKTQHYEPVASTNQTNDKPLNSSFNCSRQGHRGGRCTSECEVAGDENR